MRHARLLATLTYLIGLMLTGGTTYAADNIIYTGVFSNKAVSGFDTVAYFTKGRALEGSSAYKTTYMGADWLFSSEENLRLFEDNPGAYTPQYGGYCAWAVSQGKLASSEPQQWKIVDGKLYLNYDKTVKARWEKDIVGFIEQADKNWPSVLE